MTSQYDFPLITLGNKATALLSTHPLKEYDADWFLLLVTDDASVYEHEIHTILTKGDLLNRNRYLVVDLNPNSDYKRHKEAWRNYNKVKDDQSVKDLATFVLHHLTHASIISFDNRDFLGVCSQGEYLGSICAENGLDGLKKLNVPANAKALVTGFGFTDPSTLMMEQMNEVSDFLQKIGEGTEIIWTISSAPKDEVTLVYSYNK